MAFTAVTAHGSATEPFQLAGKNPIHHSPGAQDTHDRLFEYAGGHLGVYGFLCVSNAHISGRVMVSSWKTAIGTSASNKSSAPTPLTPADTRRTRATLR